MKKTIKVSDERREYIKRLLSEEPSSEEEMLIGPFDSISETVDFGNNIQMDIKVCGVDFEDGSCNLPYTEAVLFDNGAEVACTEPDEAFFGEWVLEYNDNVYIAEVF